MTEIPKPPRPSEATNVLGGGLIPKRPIPPYIEPPRIEYIGGDDLGDNSLSCSWCLWFFGICIGIAIGLQLAKVIN